MLTLILLRHAKSSWSNPGLADVDRPLATRGLNDAPLMGKAMAELFGAEGAQLVLADISGKQDEVAAAINASASGSGANAVSAVPVHCDVSS